MAGMTRSPPGSCAQKRKISDTSESGNLSESTRHIKTLKPDSDDGEIYISSDTGSPTTTFKDKTARKSSDSTSSGGDSLEGISFVKGKLKTDSEETESRESSESPSTTSFTPVQEWTSYWTEDTLNRLQIKSNTVNPLSASEIISNHLFPSLTPFIIMALADVPSPCDLLTLERIVDGCVECLDIYRSPLNKLNVEDITDLSCTQAYNLMFKHPMHDQRDLMKRQIRSWIPGRGHSDIHYKNWFCQMYYIHGQRFTNQLISMCTLLKKGDNLKESMFESLFQDFAGMFGLLSIKQQTGTSMNIGNTKVTSKEDIFFPHFRESNEEKLSILALCEVKREFEEKAVECTVTTRQQDGSTMKKPKYRRHLNDRLLGQHGGELLVHLPQARKHSLLGIVVQRTNITFSHMCCTQDQLDTIQSGKPITQLQEIHYSRSYNYLKAADRPELIKAFLTLGVIQLNPFV